MPDFGNPFSGMTSDRILGKEELLRAIRFVLAAEYEAVQLYMQLAESTDNADVKKVLKDVADEEIVHAGEFLRLVKILNPEEESLLKKGEREVNKLLKTACSVTANLDSISSELEKEHPVIALAIDHICDLIEKKLGMCRKN